MAVTWRGSSGMSYEYESVEVSQGPPNNRKGNYVFARLVGIYWQAVYVGQGDLHDRYYAARGEGCVTRMDATHYHFHNRNELSEARRKSEETDIINGHPECKGPNRCNGKD